MGTIRRGGLREPVAKLCALESEIDLVGGGLPFPSGRGRRRHGFCSLRHDHRRGGNDLVGLTTGRSRGLNQLGLPGTDQRSGTARSPDGVATLPPLAHTGSPPVAATRLIRAASPGMSEGGEIGPAPLRLRDRDGRAPLDLAAGHAGIKPSGQTRALVDERPCRGLTGDPKKASQGEDRYTEHSPSVSSIERAHGRYGPGGPDRLTWPSRKPPAPPPMRHRLPRGSSEASVCRSNGVGR